MPRAPIRCAAVAALAVLLTGAGAGAQGSDSAGARGDSAGPSREAKSKAWYEKLSLRGYTQLRYNRLLGDATCAGCVATSARGGFLVRRARLVFSGNVHDRLAIYIQPDLAHDAAGQQHYLQLRDAYFDLFLDAGRTHRLRFGQSKIPYAFENLQSSSNRAPLERADATNSAVPGERDLGVIYYLTPPAIRERFKRLTDSGLKGSGDYGVLGVGLYNGQGANRPELNDKLHGIVHLAYPFAVGATQIVELGAHAYRGRYVLPSSQRSADVTGAADFADARVAGTFVLYPQPLGLQAEWNVGRGPSFDAADTSIRTRRLEGGYVQAMYRARIAGHTVTPFVRAHRYDGGRKSDTDARRHDVEELEGGVEWIPVSPFELTATWVASDRVTEDGAAVGRREKAQFLRFQAQFTY